MATAQAPRPAGLAHVATISFVAARIAPPMGRRRR